MFNNETIIVVTVSCLRPFIKILQKYVLKDQSIIVLPGISNTFLVFVNEYHGSVRRSKYLTNPSIHKVLSACKFPQIMVWVYVLVETCFRGNNKLLLVKDNSQNQIKCMHKFLKPLFIKLLHLLWK